MHDGLEPADRRLVADDAGAERRPVHRALPHRAGERGGDGGHCAPALRLQPVHGGIGVEDRDAGAPERGGRGGLPHADAAREPDHAHAAPRGPGSAPAPARSRKNMHAGMDARRRGGDQARQSAPSPG